MSAFGAVDSNHVFFVDVNNDLWLQVGSFGSPPLHVDGNVAGILPVDSEEIYVLGTDGKLWLENAPFGTVPLPLCSQTTGFGKGFACRQLVAANVNAFGVSPDTGGVFIVDFNLNLVQLGAPPITIDGNVIAFQLLSAEQTFSRAHQHLRMRRARSAPRGGVGPGASVPAS